MSVSSVSLSSDANVRYQRLAQEYTKLRAQAKVLREGVLEERSKVEKLTEEVKGKEAVIRRLQSENDSLTFRNDQLVRRVESFQFQTTSSSSSSKKATSSSNHPNADATPPRIEILEHELQLKLAENEKLVSQVAENERQHAIEMAEMSEKLAREMRKLEEEVKLMRMRSKFTKDEEVDRKEEKKVEKVEELAEIGSPEPPESAEEARMMVAEAARGTFSAFHNVFSLLQQRSEIYPYDVTMERLPVHVEKLSSEYAQTARLFSDLTDIIDGFLARSAILPDQEFPMVTSKLRLISCHCVQMLAELIVQMTSEESRVTWCTPPLAKLNEEWKQLILKMFDVFERITGALEAFSTSSDLDTVIEKLEELEDVTMRIFDCFQNRWIFESRLPTTTRRMRCVGGALEAALQIMTQESSKLHARAKRVKFMSNVEPEKPAQEPYNPFEEADDVDPNISETSEENLSRKAENWAQESIDESQKETSSEQSTPRAEDATKLAEKSRDVAENPTSSMQSELKLALQKNEELQKERDRLFVEYSLCKRKLEIATNDGAKIDTNQTDMDQIWAIGMERRDEWIERVHVAEKAVRFYENELELLLRHEVAAGEHLNQVRAELDAVSNQNHRLEDELESVRRSYESQLGDLSDHLATLVKEKERDKEASKSRGSLKSFFNKSSS
uniref:Protein phosphatase 1 regulatory subunit 21 n=2 Tax=Caenorhabditis japonica TaxID=281687 RepID=A0A8R1DV58_CAEJA